MIVNKSAGLDWADHCQTLLQLYWGHRQQLNKMHSEFPEMLLQFKSKLHWKYLTVWQAIWSLCWQIVMDQEFQEVQCIP